ncbi:transmembrane protein 42 [Dermochelys coriacea]|uniref:transmembrane protein 42 n=1 Tax=Dermochelys coriacea TaxID=27794 RepID=UPI0018E7E556|nr:transmembrane protein 42 [Dermochelys coriacea]
MLAGWGAAHSAVAGLLGALAACSAKLALGGDYLREACAAAAAGACVGLHVVLRVGCVGLVFACNAVMWTFFAKALHYSSSSATATVTTTASNIISSAFLGRLLFGETRALLWWVGISVMLCGLLLLHTASLQTEQQQSEKKDK